MIPKLVKARPTFIREIDRNANPHSHIYIYGQKNDPTGKNCRSCQAIIAARGWPQLARLAASNNAAKPWPLGNPSPTFENQWLPFQGMRLPF